MISYLQVNGNTNRTMTAHLPAYKLDWKRKLRALRKRQHEVAQAIREHLHEEADEEEDETKAEHKAELVRYVKHMSTLILEIYHNQEDSTRKFVLCNYVNGICS